jgi:molybdate transport system permease protein
MTTFRAQRMGAVFSGGVLVLFLALPLIALGTMNGGDLVAGLRSPLVAPALRLSLLTTTVSLLLVVLFGTPLAWLLARSRSRAAHALETALQLPIVVPPAVAGIALLLAFGRRGLLSGWLYPAGESASFTTVAVVMAEVFVSAPFFVQSATSAFRRVDGRILLVARSFGASPARVFGSCG